MSNCQLCGEPMPEGEEMFNYHGYSGPCQKPPLPKVKTGVERIAAERQRQIDVEHWTPQHDDKHGAGELSAAAECYVAYASEQMARTPVVGVPMQWPWDEHWWKPSPDPVRNLEKAGALIAAEIDRVQRKS